MVTGNHCVSQATTRKCLCETSGQPTQYSRARAALALYPIGYSAPVLVLDVSLARTSPRRRVQHATKAKRQTGRATSKPCSASSRVDAGAITTGILRSRRNRLLRSAHRHCCQPPASRGERGGPIELSIALNPSVHQRQNNANKTVVMGSLVSGCCRLMNADLGG